MTENIAAEVDSSNVEQLRAWDGDDGAYWATHADRFDEGLAGYHDQLLAAAAIEATATVLDAELQSLQWVPQLSGWAPSMSVNPYSRASWAELTDC